MVTYEGYELSVIPPDPASKPIVLKFEPVDGGERFTCRRKYIRC
jgi:hypothetical protein